MGRLSFSRLLFVILTLCLITGAAFAAPVEAHVPEAGTLALFGSGLIGLAALVRRHFSE